MSAVPPNVNDTVNMPQHIVGEVKEQIVAEQKAAGGTMSASEIRDIMASQALLDARAMPSVILEGEMGTGKTASLATLLMDANGKFEGPSMSGIERVLMLTSESGFEDVVGHIPPTKLDWRFIPVSEGSFDALIGMVQTIRNQHPDAIQKMGGINKHMYPQFEQILGACNRFVGDRTGKDYGPVFKLPQNFCLWHESISALSEIARNNAIGDKPFMELRDYQMVQNPIRKFLNHLVFSTKCLFVSTAHLEREQNETSNMSELMISTVGRKLAPVIPRFFSDVIICDRIDVSGGQPKFIWSTVKPGVRTKTRNLPWASDLKPDFRPLMENFRKRQAQAKAGQAMQQPQ